MHKLRTGVSAAYWCDPAKGYVFDGAYLPSMTRATGKHTAWFDELFEGGLLIPPKGSGTAMTLLISGLPGTGKSTLALEFCYRTAMAKGDDHLNSLYITTEGHAPWLITHAREFGWDKERKILSDKDGKAPVYIKSLKTERDLAHFKREVGGPAREPGGAQQKAVSGLIKFIDGFYTEFLGQNEAADTSEPRRRVKGTLDFASVDTLVFDNLNTLKVDKSQWFTLLTDLGHAGPRLVIVVLDAAHTPEYAETWEYLADTVIRMGNDNRSGYMIRTIEIIKSRYQLSALGRHQVKVQKSLSMKPFPPAWDQEKIRKEGHLRMRHHPFRNEGGVFIYPSMHFVLSRHKYANPSGNRARIRTPFEALEIPLRGGFHHGRCVALVGGHGTHKSRVAFAQLLFTLYSDPAARAIVISLGEDEESMLGSLNAIDREQIGFSAIRATQNVYSLADAGRLEVAYYPPGFITPEEFFHRIQLSIARHRHSGHDSPLLLVFNSLTLLNSHFPLCADHKIFIPAVVELLGHEGVTSFFVTATEGERDEYGLLSLADPILNFKRDPIDRKDFADHILPDSVDQNILHLLPDRVSVVRMEVTRFAEGTSAGAFCYVVLVSEGDPLAKEQGGIGTGLHIFIGR